MEDTKKPPRRTAFFIWLGKGEPRRTGLILDYYSLPIRQCPPSARAEREARRVARAQRLVEGPSTAALARLKAQQSPLGLKRRVVVAPLTDGLAGSPQPNSAI